MKTRVVLRLFFILGFTIPYLYQSYNSPYINYLCLIIQGIAARDLLAIPSILGIMSIIVYAGKIFFWSSDWYKSLFASIIIGLTFFPAMLFITSIAFLNDLFNMSVKMYMTGFAVTLAVVPLLILTSQVEAVVRLRGSVTTPAIGTLMAYYTINLLIAVESKDTLVMDLPTLGFNLLRQTGATLLAFFSSQNASPASVRGMTLSPEVVLIGAVFALTSAFYFYFRLHYAQEEQTVLTSTPKVLPTSFFNMGLTILAAISLNLIVLQLTSASTTVLLPLVNFSLIGAVLLVLVAIPRS